MELSNLIIYQDDSVIVINKPSGLVVHPDGKIQEETLVDLILRSHPEMAGVGEPMVVEHKGTTLTIDRPGIVHRLDRDTSGVLIIARTQDAFLHLKAQFKDRLTKKKYRAFLYGNIKDDQGTVDEPIGRSPSDIRMWSAGRGKRGTIREAITNWKVLARGKDGGESVTYVELLPKTGRTHQLRVHMKYNNTPIIHDSLYAPGRPDLLGFSRLALHAHELTITLPDEKMATFEAPLPPDFQTALGHIESLHQ